MHEYALTKRMVQIVNETAAQHGATRVSKAFLVIGQDSCIAPDALRMHFDLIARGTAAHGAELIVRVTKPRMRCPQCAHTFERPRFSFACPACGALGSPIGGGDECTIERVELLTPD